MVVQENIAHNLTDHMPMDGISSSISADSLTTLSSSVLASTPLSITLPTYTSLATTLSPSSPLAVSLPPSTTVLSPSLVSASGIESSLHVLEQLPALDMTYKGYRIVPETSHDQLLTTASLDDTQTPLSLEVLSHPEHSQIVTVMSPRHESEQIPLPELQPHDFSGLTSLKSPDGARSPTYISTSPTQDVIRTYLIPSDALRSSSFTIEQGVDMSKTNLFIRYSLLKPNLWRVILIDFVGGVLTRLHNVACIPLILFTIYCDYEDFFCFIIVCIFWNGFK